MSLWWIPDCQVAKERWNFQVDPLLYYTHIFGKLRMHLLCLIMQEKLIGMSTWSTHPALPLSVIREVRSKPQEKLTPPLGSLPQVLGTYFRTLSKRRVVFFFVGRLGSADTFQMFWGTTVYCTVQNVQHVFGIKLVKQLDCQSTYVQIWWHGDQRQSWNKKYFFVNSDFLEIQIWQK